VDVVGPTSTFISEHTCILNLYSTPLRQEGLASLRPVNVFIFRNPLQEGVQNSELRYYQRVVVGPTSTFLSHHTCIFTVIFSPIVTRGTYIPPATHFYNFWTCLQEGSRNLNYDSPRVVVGIVGPTPTFLSQHICLFNITFNTAVTRGTYIPTDTQFCIFWTPLPEGVQKSELR
jgi:hypothetical protein